MKKSIICIFLFFAAALQAQDISSIISKTESNYSTLKVYLDSGKVISSFYNLASPHKSAILFKTAYKPTGEFNFEFYQLGTVRLNIVNRDGNNKVMKYFGSAAVEVQSFALAMAGATGISSGAAIMIPNLLMPGEIKTRHKNIFRSISDAKLEASEVIDGRSCYKIMGKEDPEDKEGYVRIWISKADYLIRKIETDRKVRDFRVKTSFLFNPYSLKVENKDLFRFRPDREIEL